EVRSFTGRYKLCGSQLDKESSEVVAPHPIVNQETPFPFLWGFPVHGGQKGGCNILRGEVRSFAGMYKVWESLLDKESNEVVAPHPIINQKAPLSRFYGVFLSTGKKGGRKI
ncbi:hypothetical protein CEXT_687091, partial [Caerostris extrusa]